LRSDLGAGDGRGVYLRSIELAVTGRSAGGEGAVRSGAEGQAGLTGLPPSATGGPRQCRPAHTIKPRRLLAGRGKPGRRRRGEGEMRPGRPAGPDLKKLTPRRGVRCRVARADVVVGKR